MRKLLVVVLGFFCVLMMAGRAYADCAAAAKPCILRQDAACGLRESIASGDPAARSIR